MAGVTFSAEAAKRIAAATRKFERQSVDRTGDRSGSYASSPGFWAMLFGTDISGLKYTFNKVVPDPKSTFPEAFIISETLRFGFDGLAVDEAAIEANGTRCIATGTIVWMQFIGYDTNEEPIFMFSHPLQDPMMPLRPHDHRDNNEGGFAFATFHPGTSIPAMPWGM
jgi:hypothetical protein